MSNEIDLGYRPDTYFRPQKLERYLLSKVKGAVLRQKLQALFDAGRHAEVRTLLSTEGISAADRKALESFHPRLEAAVATALERHDRCLVIDCHSFPSVALPYEMADPTNARRDICIGTDDFHTSDELAGTFSAAFLRVGWRVSLNEPFAGALVPGNRYRRDARVGALIVEVNRGLYLHEVDATPSADFEGTAHRIRESCVEAVASWCL